MNAIELHQSKIAQIFHGFPGIKTSFELAPSKLDTAEIPAVYSLTGSAQDEDNYGEKEQYLQRTYRVQFAVIPTGQANPEDREKLCRDLLERCRMQLKRYPYLNNCNGVSVARVINDSGIVVLPEFGSKFVGFEIRLLVEYSEIIDFAEQE